MLSLRDTPVAFALSTQGTLSSLGNSSGELHQQTQIFLATLRSCLICWSTNPAWSRGRSRPYAAPANATPVDMTNTESSTTTRDMAPPTLNFKSCDAVVVLDRAGFDLRSDAFRSLMPTL